MSPADDKRSELLDRLADYVLAEGIGAASLRPMARAVGTSDRMLLYYFPDKNALLAATLERIAARLTETLTAMSSDQPLPLADLQKKLAGIMLDPAFRPFAGLWLEVVALSARGDALMAAVGEQIGRGFLAWGAAQLDSPTPEDRARDAARLLVTVEGSVLLAGVGMEDVAREALEDT